MTVLDNIAGVTVEIGFGVNAVGGDFFVLDDPVKGELDNTTFLLAPDTVLVAVTTDGASIEIDRGREREVDEYGAGTATVMFNDLDRTFDPAYSGSPYFGEIVPLKRIVISWNGSELFSGWVDDWAVEYEPGDTVSRVTAECVDAFGILANQELTEIAAAHTGDTSGERINRVLNRAEVDFIAARSIDEGNTIFGNTTFGENVMSYLQQCTRAEAGYLFVSADGVVTFRGRTATLNDDAAVTFSDDPDDGIPYLSITQRSSADLLFSRVTATSETTDNEVVAFDEAARDDLFIRTLDLGTVFAIDDTETQSLVDYYLERFKTPELRFQAATINAGALDAGLLAQLVDLDLTDVVTVQRSPLNVGDMIDRLSIVDGIRHRIAPGSWEVELSFANADTRSFLTLDDAVFGVLGQNRLAF